MVKKCLRMLLVLVLLSVLTACSSHKESFTMSRYLSTKPGDVPLTKRIDTYLIIIDASQSMSYSYDDERTRLEAAKDLVERINKMIPDKNVIAGIRTYGQKISPFGDETVMVYGFDKYDETLLSESITAIDNPMGRSPLVYAMNGATEDLKNMTGHVGVIILTDGWRVEEKSIEAAENMKNELGDRVYIYPVQVGDDKEGRKVLDKVAEAGGTGFSLPYDYLSNDKTLERFVNQVFIAADGDGDGVADEFDWCPDTQPGVMVDQYGCPRLFDLDGDGVYDRFEIPEAETEVREAVVTEVPAAAVSPSVIAPKPAEPIQEKHPTGDTDGDGVSDMLDQCPNTPKGVSVYEWGCPVDTDRDGIYDYLDACPGTPRGTRVDTKGCPRQ
ncbi:MAG: thrombospondin type 3 repeat-containing protein [Deltaproteobacteria bacterium]|nr:thrombospondin type 3 repeat-containing protein [Deltaproteobacteria bacterium]